MWSQILHFDFLLMMRKHYQRIIQSHYLLRFRKGYPKPSTFRILRFSEGRAKRIPKPFRPIRGLNLMPNLSNPSHPSLFSILNKTRTPGGSRLMHSWLKQPLLSVEKIVERLDLVEVMVTNTEIRQVQMCRP